MDDADPLLPYPDKPDERGPNIVWTPRRLKWWAQSQLLGIQYYNQFGPVYCPSRESQWEVSLEKRLRKIFASGAEEG